MYTIFCDGDILHDSRSQTRRVVDPKCEMELNKTGTLSFRVPPNHPLFDSIKKLKSEISLVQDNETIFNGRVLNDEADIYNFKVIEVEGDLAYLLDSVQRNKVYHVENKDGENKVSIYLKDVINIHNEQVEDKKKFTVGEVTVEDDSDQLYKISSFKDTLTTLNEDLIKTFGGYFFTRIEGGVRKLNYLKESPPNSQIIQFGKNILKLEKHVKGEEIATVIIPRGATLENATDEQAEKKLDISELPEETDGTIVHPKGADYIYDSEAVEKYGWITKVVEFSDVEKPENLFEKAKAQLNYCKNPVLSLVLTVFDLHLLNVNEQSIRVGQKIRVISRPHGLDEFLIVEKMSINISSPDKSAITLKTEERLTKDISLSKKSTNTNNAVTVLDTEIKESGFVTDISLPTKFDNYLNSAAGENILNGKFDDYLNSAMGGQTLDTNFGDYLNSTAGTDILDSKIGDYLLAHGGEGGVSVDLSAYATIADVNAAFDELATLIGGI